MAGKPSVSVIMPVYNAGQYLRAAVDSILGQTYADFEFIVVDDASTDGSADIIASFDDLRIRLVRRNENGGIVAALNDGLKLAKGDFVARQDADDVSAPERLRLQVEFLKSHPDVGLLGSWYEKINENGAALVQKRTPESDADVRQASLAVNPFCHGSVIFRKELLGEVGLYRDVGGPAEDYDLWLRMLEVTKAANIAQALYFWRVNPGSIMSESSEAHAEKCGDFVRRLSEARKRTGKDPLECAEMQAVEELNSLCVAWRSAVRMSPARCKSRHAYIVAEDFLRNDDRATALWWALKAIKHYPFWFSPWRLAMGLILKR